MLRPKLGRLFKLRREKTRYPQSGICSFPGKLPLQLGSPPPTTRFVFLNLIILPIDYFPVSILHFGGSRFAVIFVMFVFPIGPSSCDDRLEIVGVSLSR